MFSKCCMRLMISHVEQTLRLSKAAGDIMACLVDSAMVQFGEFLGIIDQQQRGCNAHDGA